MMTRTIISLFFFTYFIGCLSNYNAKKSEKASLKIVLEVIPESDSSYSISWEDTVGQSRGYKFSHRPFEVWCILKDSKDTIGYYTGLSTPANFTYFSTTDADITADFMIGPNFFSDEIPEDEREKIEEGKGTVIEFNSINLNIKSILRKKFEVVLTEK